MATLIYLFIFFSHFTREEAEVWGMLVAGLRILGKFIVEAE